MHARTLNARSFRAASRVAALLTIAASAQADLKLPAIIDDHMVLQRESVVPLWGWADPGAEITVNATWSDQLWQATSDVDGRWTIDVDTPAAGGPHEIVIRGDGELRLTDVLIGEVWVCSGQSNMAWSMDATADGYPSPEAYREELGRAEYPDVRLFYLQRNLQPAPVDDCEGEWKACEAGSVRSFSAVAYYFGRRLHEDLDVPIGLIGTYWGGSTAEAWMTRETLERFPEMDDRLAFVQTIASDPNHGADALAARIDSWWQRLDEVDPGHRGGWHRPGFSDRSWDVAQLPGLWDETALGAFDGIVWYRRTVRIPNDWDGRELTLQLGPIDDMDTVWFNGRRVGGYERPGHWQTPRNYSIPGDLVESGEATIAVRVVDTGGGGGFNGRPDDLRLRAGRNALPIDGPWRVKAGTPLANLDRWPSGPRISHQSPTCLSNGMIDPILPYGIRGAIWYQGESNRGQAYLYRSLFPALIEDWRQRWGRGDFPFYFVQIAPFLYGGDVGQTAELREAQFMTLSLSNTGMVVTSDVANPRDIHPRNKLDVGERLARWALTQTYPDPRWDDLAYSGPLYRSMRIEDGAIRLYFDHVGEGLASIGGPLTHFTIAGEDRVFHPALAYIDGPTVVVRNDAVQQPRAVRFSWGTADEPNFFNQDGLPASPFRTDHWPGVTEPK
jgi:sialate O-acetylesterase